MVVYDMAIVGQIIFNAYFFFRASKIISSTLLKNIFKGWMIIELGIYLFGLVFQCLLPHVVMQTIMAICSTWYFASIYGIIACGIIELLWWLIKKFTHKRKFAYGNWLFGLLFIGISFIIIRGYWVVKHPIISTYSIKLHKPFPKPLNHLKICLITDIHISESITPSYINKMVYLALSQKPDIVLIGGDIFDYKSYWGTIGSIQKDMKRLATEPQYGCYAVMGNHEYRADTETKKKWLTDCGIHLLLDSVVQPMKNFNLICRDDKENKGRKSLKELMIGCDTILPSIQLAHQPEDLSDIAKYKIDLSLFGHTHNGQIWPFSLLVKAKYKGKSYGLYYEDGFPYYISCGLGAAGPSIRCFTKSEIAIIDLHN